MSLLRKDDKILSFNIINKSVESKVLSKEEIGEVHLDPEPGGWQGNGASLGTPLSQENHKNKGVFWSHVLCVVCQVWIKLKAAGP